ncbi:unnamed protein product [Amoebophrya sp. A25]|nr:unnamed protein product [Amoebophrya sp. A25]|eukprot:GSA25T00015267001.1
MSRLKVILRGRGFTVSEETLSGDERKNKTVADDPNRTECDKQGIFPECPCLDALVLDQMNHVESTAKGVDSLRVAAGFLEGKDEARNWTTGDENEVTDLRLLRDHLLDSKLVDWAKLRKDSTSEMDGAIAPRLFTDDMLSRIGRDSRVQRLRRGRSLKMLLLKAFENFYLATPSEKNRNIYDLSLRHDGIDTSNTNQDTDDNSESEVTRRDGVATVTTAGYRPREPCYGRPGDERQKNATVTATQHYQHIDLIYQSPTLLIANKPAGVSTEQVIAYLAKIADCRSVSRLDRGTSGVLVTAIDTSSSEFLKEEFRSRRVEKSYLCLVNGRVPMSGEQTRLDYRLQTTASGRTHVSYKGKEAQTNFLCLAHYSGLADGMESTRSITTKAKEKGNKKLPTRARSVVETENLSKDSPPDSLVLEERRRSLRSSSSRSSRPSMSSEKTRTSSCGALSENGVSSSEEEGGPLSSQRPAATAQSSYYSLMLCFPKTGRTHQIRVHMKTAGYPLVGDAKYDPIRGRAKRCLNSWCPRLFLHCWRMTLREPVSDSEVSAAAPVPSELRKVIQVLDRVAENEDISDTNCLKEVFEDIDT